MSFKDRLIRAGFPSKRNFAHHIENDVSTVSRWGDNPPKLVELYLDALLSKESGRKEAIELCREHMIKSLADAPIYKE